MENMDKGTISRHKATPSQRVAVPIYPLFSFFVGLSFLPEHWGFTVLFLVSAAVMWLGMILTRAAVYVVGLGVLVIGMLVLAGGFAYAAYEGRVNVFVWIWPITIARLAWARMIEQMAIAFQERQ